MVNIYECCYKAIKKQYKTILSYEKGVFDDVDIENVHQMRVSVRRVRSAMRSFNPCIDEKYEQLVLADLKQLARKLGAVRDLDVSILCFEEYKQTFPENDGVDFLIKYYQKRRKRCLKDLFKYLKSKKYCNLKKKLLMFIDYLYEKSEKEANDNFSAAFYNSFEMIIDDVFAYKKVADLKNSEDDLHNLRIAIKYLRYNLEFMALKDKEAKIPLKILKDYQEKLGVINDCVIMNYRITKIMAKTEIDQFVIEGIEGFLDYNESLKNKEKNEFEFPWDVLSLEIIKKLYIPNYRK